jgi:hypothetical protein
MLRAKVKQLEARQGGATRENNTQEEVAVPANPAIPEGSHVTIRVDDIDVGSGVIHRVGPWRNHGLINVSGSLSYLCASLSRV